jgi:hypothetical protein
MLLYSVNSDCQGQVSRTFCLPFVSPELGGGTNKNIFQKNGFSFEKCRFSALLRVSLQIGEKSFGLCNLLAAGRVDGKENRPQTLDNASQSGVNVLAIHYKQEILERMSK